LLDIGKHPDHDLAAALDHAEDRWLLLLQGAATAAALQSVAPAFASFGQYRLGIAFVPGHNVELVELDIPAQDDVGRRRHDAVAQHLGMAWTSLSHKPSSCVIWRFDRFTPMKYEPNIQVEAG
jgi:hypothetical protein